MFESKRNHQVKIGSERGLGLVFAAAFSIVGIIPIVEGSGDLRIWSFVVAMVFGILGLFAPKSLAPLNQIWFNLGMFLGKVTSPIILFLVFSITMVPIGLIMRAFGKDLLKTKIDKSENTYWQKRKEPMGTMKNQF